MSVRWVVLFDWDGTLIESLEIKINNAARLFHEILALEPSAVAAAYRRHSGIPRRELFYAICAENGLPDLSESLYQRLSMRFSEMNLASLTDKRLTHLISTETTLALEALKKLGYPLYVSSSAITEEIRLIARLWDVEKYFYEILGSKDGFSKGPQHVEYAIQQQKVARSQIVFVGDEPADIVLGKAAGVLVIAKTGTYSNARLMAEGADRAVGSLCELPEVLSQNQPI